MKFNFTFGPGDFFPMFVIWAMGVIFGGAVTLVYIANKYDLNGFRTCFHTLFS